MNKTKHYKIFDFTLPTLIVGVGGTGLSCARLLKQKGCHFSFADSRKNLSLMADIKKQYPLAEILTGDFDVNKFSQFQQIIVSPGVSIRSGLFASLKKQGCFVLGDVELFAQLVDKPVIAITGSNGKSTVTTLVEKIAADCGIKVFAGGNLGVPALDLLNTKSDLYILELSSFQLETTYSLKTLSATVLNVSEDHMDRYTGMQDYRTVKETIYNNTEYAIVNIEEDIILDHIINNIETKEHYYFVILFGSKKPVNKDYGLVKSDDGFDLIKGSHKIIKSNETKLIGTYNYLNILAALALLEPLQLDESRQLAAIREYNGLEHRCEWVAEFDNIQFYNDSKGTNTGAAIAAIDGFDKKTVILIAGGVAKDADFTELGHVIATRIKFTILMGVDADEIKLSALSAGARGDSLYSVDSMQQAVQKACELAESGNVILFSPACASFDMYQNYQQRGDDFKEKVMTWIFSKQDGELQNVS